MKKVNLEEYIHPKVDILFVALNAPEISNSNAHWFSANLNFWNILFEAGLSAMKILGLKAGGRVKLTKMTILVLKSGKDEYPLL